MTPLSVTRKWVGQIGQNLGLVHSVEQVLGIHSQSVGSREHLPLALLAQGGDGVLLGQPHLVDELSQVFVEQLLGSFNLQEEYVVEAGVPRLLPDLYPEGDATHASGPRIGHGHHRFPGELNPMPSVGWKLVYQGSHCSHHRPQPSPTQLNTPFLSSVILPAGPEFERMVGGGARTFIVKSKDQGQCFVGCHHIPSSLHTPNTLLVAIHWILSHAKNE